MNIGARLRLYVKELPNALMLAVLTAVVTLLLAVLLSAVLGGAQDQHRLQTRCYGAIQIEMLRDAFAANPIYADILEKYPPVNIEGIDCSFITDPFHEVETD